jgi:outer membrane protein OmpA-like peptidoglycan-associated protein
MMKRLALVLFVCSLAALAQQSAPRVQVSASAPSTAAAPTSVSHITKAVNYRHRGGATKIDFRGTELMSGATGAASIQSKNGRIEIDARFDGIDEATKFGLEYLTYVMWAVSPQGRAVNLGEVQLDHGRSHVKAISDMQTFGLIVTAEPYFAVTQPGNMVVMENIVRTDTVGKEENIDARFELLGRGTYASTNTRINDAIFGVDRKTPLELFEARNAVRIAHIANADKYAPTILSKAEQQLRQAEEAYVRKQGKGVIGTAAREAVETAEEARVMSVKAIADEDGKVREANARAQAEAEGKRRQEAEAARRQAEQERAKAEAAKAEAERMKQEAQAAAEEAARQRQEAETAKAAALAQQQQLAAEAEKARNAAQESDRLRQQAEKEKSELRARLLQQLNTILATRDSARGLIANMSDVLFETGKYELRPDARERLAKVSGIVLAYPGLHLEIEGHTDSVGTDEYNQQLSERRAQAVRDYLVQQGIGAGAIVARGLGKTSPIAPNDTPEGRQKNRRVELVLSGDAIGMNGNESAQAATTPAASMPRQ